LLTVLAATSGDTGSAVAHAFHGVPHTRVVVLYPEGRVSPTQEAQLTMFNSEAGNVRAYAVAGSFDDCHRLTKEVFGNAEVCRRVRLTSANSVNIGRLLPQMVYYFHAVGQLGAQVGRVRPERADGAGRPSAPEIIVSTPSGNFGNLTAGVMAKRAGLPITRFVAATNINDVVPEYLLTGRFEPRPSVPTIANAMDVGNPSNFERMLWLYDRNREAMRQDIAGSQHGDQEVRETIRRVYETRGYLLDPHSAIAYLGLKQELRALDPAASSSTRTSAERVGVFLATAHPAKFGEIVEPIIRRPIVTPAPLADALARPRHILRIDASFDAVTEALGA
jgi:threonine synthase